MFVRCACSCLWGSIRRVTPHSNLIFLPWRRHFHPVTRTTMATSLLTGPLKVTTTTFSTSNNCTDTTRIFVVQHRVRIATIRSVIATVLIDGSERHFVPPIPWNVNAANASSETSFLLTLTDGKEGGAQFNSRRFYPPLSGNFSKATTRASRLLRLTRHHFSEHYRNDATRDHVSLNHLTIRGVRKPIHPS